MRSKTGNGPIVLETKLAGSGRTSQDHVRARGQRAVRVRGMRGGEAGGRGVQGDQAGVIALQRQVRELGPRPRDALGGPPDAPRAGGDHFAQELGPEAVGLRREGRRIGLASFGHASRDDELSEAVPGVPAAEDVAVEAVRDADRRGGVRGNEDPGHGGVLGALRLGVVRAVGRVDLAPPEQDRAPVGPGGDQGEVRDLQLEVLPVGAHAQRVPIRVALLDGLLPVVRGAPRSHFVLSAALPVGGRAEDADDKRRRDRADGAMHASTSFSLLHAGAIRGTRRAGSKTPRG